MLSPSPPHPRIFIRRFTIPSSSSSPVNSWIPQSNQIYHPIFILIPCQLVDSSVKSGLRIGSLSNICRVYNNPREATWPDYKNIGNDVSLLKDPTLWPLPHKRHPIQHKAVDMDSQQGIDGDYRKIIFVFGVVLAELIASQPSLPRDAKEAIKLNTLIAVAIAERLIKIVSEGFGLSSSCSTQNAHLLPNFYGSQMQSQTGVQSVMPHLHFDLDAFQKYYELCAGSIDSQFSKAPMNQSQIVTQNETYHRDEN
nr:hypothetical protein [Tanacetum cinerariifolium]